MTTEPQKTLVPFGKQGVQLASLEDAFRFATAVSKSGFAPKGVETPEAILIAVQFGAELGLTPMSALQSLAIINGRPSIYGDAALALVRSSGYLESYTQSTSGEGDNLKATVTVKRKDEQAITAEFSVADAKKAQLWGKAGPWSQYPARMLMWRARGFALRDAFGDVLRGLATVEENQDLDPVASLKVMKPVFAKEKKVEVAALPETSEAVAEPPKESAGSVTIEQTIAMTSDSEKLKFLISRSGLQFADFVPVLNGSRLCATNAKSVDDMTDARVSQAVKDWEVILAATIEERKQEAP